MQWSRPGRSRPPWYKPVPKGLWFSLGLNAGMVAWNVTFLTLFPSIWMAFWATFSSAVCLFVLESILNWKKAHDW